MKKAYPKLWSTNAAKVAKELTNLKSAYPEVFTGYKVAHGKGWASLITTVPNSTGQPEEVGIKWAVPSGPDDCINNFTPYCPVFYISAYSDGQGYYEHHLTLKSAYRWFRHWMLACGVKFKRRFK